VSNFQHELEELINRYSQENISNTPDFILAEYLKNTLTAFNLATQQRTAWYKPRPKKLTTPTTGTSDKENK
jgi:hypothetical protein